MEAAYNCSRTGRFLRRQTMAVTAGILFSRTGRFLRPRTMAVTAGTLFCLGPCPRPRTMAVTAETLFRTGRFLLRQTMAVTAETCGSYNSHLEKQPYSGFLTGRHEAGVWL